MDAKDEKKAEAAPADGAAAPATEAVPELTQEMILKQVQEQMEYLDAKEKKKGPQSVVLGKSAMGATTTEEAKPEPIKVGTSKANMDTEGNLAPGEHKKLQAMLGAAKAKDSKTYAGLKGEVTELKSDDVDPRATLIFANCEDCHFTVNAMVTKIFVQACKNVKIHFNEKIVTHMVEFYKCHGITGVFDTKVGTMQCDMSHGLDLSFNRKEDFGSIIWAGCHKLSVKTLDSGHSILTGFGDMQEEYADLHEERSQFKLHLFENNLINEKVIRLDNGFPTTKREKDAFEAKQEANMKILAQNLGIVIPKKKKEGPKLGRNDSCDCGSGRKYKKCCGHGVAP